MKKNIVAGLGEIGYPIYKLLSKNSLVVGYDIEKKLMNLKISIQYYFMYVFLIQKNLKNM
jgi:UDP-N-acetyl-D-mannosaminuronate dehydrogenase